MVGGWPQLVVVVHASNGGSSSRFLAFWPTAMGKLKMEASVMAGDSGSVRGGQRKMG